MRLSEFILANIEPILAEWEAFAGSLAPGEKMGAVELRDDAGLILRATARDMQNRQSLHEQASKSKGTGGAGGAASDRLDIASNLHGVERMGSGFDITEVVAEYRALRASVLRLWRESLPEARLEDIEDITRFNESLDQSLVHSVGSYSKRVDESRHMFLAILSHDLRNPLSSIRMVSEVFLLKNENPATAHAMSAIKRNTEAMLQLISDLIDFSTSGLGRAMPLKRAPVDLEALCREVIDLYRITHPGRVLRLHSDGDVNGFWDAGRIRQILSNLVGNALQHGSPDGPIDLSVTSIGTPSAGSGLGGSTLVLRVHNEGAPIRPEHLPTIFDPLKRYTTWESALQRSPGSVGLGLYIVREIVVAEGGTVTVTSTAEKGTTFTVRIPRFPSVEADNRDNAKPGRQPAAGAGGGAWAKWAFVGPSKHAS